MAFWLVFCLVALCDERYYVIPKTTTKTAATTKTYQHLYKKIENLKKVKTRIFVALLTFVCVVVNDEINYLYKINSINDNKL